MNWKEIKEKYPKALTRLLNWFSEEEIDLNGVSLHSDGLDLHYNHINHAGSIYFRDLYDFFDVNEMFIEVGVYTREKFEFIWDIQEMKNNELLEVANGNKNINKDRLKAEQAAFTKAFELLENKN